MKLDFLHLIYSNIKIEYANILIIISTVKKYYIVNFLIYTKCYFHIKDGRNSKYKNINNLLLISIIIFEIC